MEPLLLALAAAEGRELRPDEAARLPPSISPAQQIQEAVDANGGVVPPASGPAGERAASEEQERGEEVIFDRSGLDRPSANARRSLDAQSMGSSSRARSPGQGDYLPPAYAPPPPQSAPPQEKSSWQ